MDRATRPRTVRSWFLDRYDKARRAISRVAGRPTGDHPQATELLHGAYERLTNAYSHRHLGEGEFYDLLRATVRHLKLDDIKMKHAQKRSGGWRRFGLSFLAKRSTHHECDFVDLRELLMELGTRHPDEFAAIELVAAGHSISETAEKLGISEATVSRRLAYFRLTLNAALRRNSRGAA